MASAPRAVRGSAEALARTGHAMLKDARDSDLMPSLGQDVVPSASGMPLTSCKQLISCHFLLLVLGFRPRQHLCLHHAAEEFSATDSSAIRRITVVGQENATRRNPH